MSQTTNTAEEQTLPHNPLIEQERTALNAYLSKQGHSPTLLSDHFGTAGLERLLSGLTTLEEQLTEATKAARQGNMLLAAHLLGAGAKITKDHIYETMVELSGGWQKTITQGITGAPAILRDYIMQKYDGGVRQCEFILQLPPSARGA